MPSFGHASVIVTDEPTVIATVGSLRNQNWLIRNSGPSVVYLGGDNVTADQTETGGFPIDAGQWFPLPATISYVTLHGIVAKGERACVSYLTPQ